MVSLAEALGERTTLALRTKFEATQQKTVAPKSNHNHHQPSDEEDIDPLDLSAEEIVEQIALRHDAIADIRLQLEANEVAKKSNDPSLQPKGDIWQIKAQAKIYHFERNIRQLEGIQKNRLENAVVQVEKLKAKLKRIHKSKESQESQHKLFVDWMRQKMTRQEFSETWAQVRAAFPNHPAWERVE